MLGYDGVPEMKAIDPWDASIIAPGVLEANGKIVNRDTCQPWHPSDACTTDGITAGADPHTYVEAVRAVKEFLTFVFKLSR